jgi:hypothetical protein
MHARGTVEAARRRPGPPARGHGSYDRSATSHLWWDRPGGGVVGGPVGEDYVHAGKVFETAQVGGDSDARAPFGGRGDDQVVGACGGAGRMAALGRPPIRGPR